MQRKSTANLREARHSSATRARKAKPDFEVPLTVTEPIAEAANAVYMEDVASLSPESPIVAATVEQPLPLMMAGTALWGLGVTAFMLIPMATATFLAAPLIFANKLFQES